MNSKISYEVSGDGAPLYLIHGVGANKNVWDGVVNGLVRHFTCVRYDLRGHGDSATPTTPFTLTQLVDDLEMLRAELGHEKIHLAGHSLGGMIAPAFARRHPDRAASLALLSTAACRTADDRAKLQAVLDAMRQRGVKAIAGELTARWFTDDFIAARPDAVAARIRQVSDTPEAVFLNVFEIYATTEMQPWLADITHPTLLVTGALDAACNPRLNTAMAAALPNAELTVLADLKHSILIQAPDRVLAPLQKFFLAHRW